MSDSSKKAILVPQDNLDKIIYAIPSYLVKADSVGLANLTIPMAPYQLLPKGIYTYDGGNTWYDMANYLTVTSLNPDLAISAFSQSDGGINIQINQSALVNGGNPVDVTMKFALLATPGMDLIDTDNTYFSGKNAYSDGNKYLEVFKQDSFQINSASASFTPIFHGLNAIPFVEVFMLDPSPPGGISLMKNFFGLPGAAADGIRVDKNNLYINTAVHGGSPILTIYYKIYKET